jgi:hypothetical protein
VLGLRNTYSASRERVAALMSDSMSGVLMLATPGLTAVGYQLRSEVLGRGARVVEVRYARSDEERLANKR